MTCKKCGHDDNRVHATLDNFMLENTVRHRLCIQCGNRFVTVEKCTGETWGKNIDNGTPDMFPDEYYVQRREQAKEAQAEALAQRIARHINGAAA